MLVSEDVISNDVIILGMCFSIFVYICFALIIGNLAAQLKGSRRGTGRGIQIPEKYM